MAKFREARTAHLAAIKNGSIQSFNWGKYEDPYIGEPTVQILKAIRETKISCSWC
jgi:hypothetical protein